MILSHYIKNLRQKGQRRFTLAELMADLSLKKNAALNAVYRARQKGDLISPSKGLYVIVPPEHQPYGSIPAEELVPILMNHLGMEYYVGLLSAAAFYGAAHQKTFHFQIVTNKNIKHPLSFGQIKIEVIRKKALSDLPMREFAVNTGYIKVASPELTAIDLLSYVHRTGGLNNVATVLAELVENIDVKKLIELSEKTKARHQLQRIGYILEKIETTDDDKKNNIIAAILNYLKNIKQYYIPLASEISSAGCSRCIKWKIIENSTIESDL